MDVASYDEEGGAGARRRGRGGAGAAVRRLAAAAGRGRRRSGRSRRLLAEVRGTVYARAKAQEAGYGLETELAEPDGALVSAAAPAAEALEALHKPLAALARRLEAVLEDAPDWLDSQARARVEGAISGLPGGARRSAPGSRCSAASAATADPEFVDWLAVERVDGREYDVAHPPPLARPDQAARQGGAGAGATACW